MSSSGVIQSYLNILSMLSNLLNKERLQPLVANRPFATNDHMVQIRHAGGQAHYYSPTGTLKQRQVKLDWFRSLCFNVAVGE